MKATDEPKCEGCKHREDMEGWCYMFRGAPDVLPCGQHDKYKTARDVTGRLLRKHPILFLGIVEAARQKS